MRDGEVPGWLKGALVAGAAIVLFVLEKRQALRSNRREDRLTRTGRNLAIAGLAGGAMAIAEMPLLRRVARHVEANELGIAYRVAKNPVVRIAVAVLLLDYGLY